MFNAECNAESVVVLWKLRAEFGFDRAHASLILLHYARFGCVNLLLLVPRAFLFSMNT